MAIDLYSTAISNYDQILSPFVTKIIFIIIVLLFGLIIGRIIGKIIFALMHEFHINVFVNSHFSVNTDIEHFTAVIVTFLIYGTTIYWILKLLGIANIVFVLLAIIIFGVIVFSLILGIREFIPNVIAGVLIQQYDLLSVGNIVDAEQFKGRIISFSPLGIMIETKSKDILFVPNITVYEAIKK